jgi:hypothetical protein
MLLIATDSPLEEKIDLLHRSPMGNINCPHTNASSDSWRELEDQKIRLLAMP